MNRQTQPSPGGGMTVTWSEGAPFTGILQLSNMEDTRIAQAQGVKANGTLSVDRSLEKYITLDTYIKNPRDNSYVRVADTGVAEAGEGIYNTRQYSVEGVTTLPR